MVKRSKELDILQTNGSNKKNKLNNESIDEHESFNLDQVQSQILKSARNYNKILHILDRLDTCDDNQFFDISASLIKIFGNLAKEGIFSRQKFANSAKEKVSQWLMEQYHEFKQLLHHQLKSSTNENIPPIALECLLKLAVVESKYMTSEDYFYPKLSFRAILCTCLAQSKTIELLDQIATEKYFNYDDFRFYFYQELAYILTDEEHDTEQKLCAEKNSTSQIVDLLLSAANYNPENSDERDWWLSEPPASKSSLKQLSPLKSSSHKIVFQKCWIAALRLPHSPSQYLKILEVVHKKIIPSMSKPQMLMDFLTDAYDAGGIVSFLALNSVFLLMQKYNLDYPNFFTKLYALLEDGTVMHVKYRSRVLKLMDLFLSSTHLPSAIAASFMKKLSRLALTAPIGATVSIVPFIYNQLKRHPTCMTLIQRPDVDEFSDLFDIEEKDPLKTNAFDSSLWELEALQYHYHPNVATLAKIMSQPFTKPQYALDDFLDYNYKSLMKTETTRRMKNPPALEYEQFDRVFGNEGYLENVTW